MWKQLKSLAPRFNDLPNKAGNGSIMRLSPLPVFFWTPSTPSELYDAAAQSCYVTHSLRSAVCVDGCVLMSAFVIGFLLAPKEWRVKEKKEKVLNKNFRLEDFLTIAASIDSATSTPLSEALTSTQMRPIHLDETYKTKAVDEIRCSGLVMCTLEVALGRSGTPIPMKR